MDFTTESADLKRNKSCSVPPDPDLLPPCRVCGGQASGLHYGVNTCHGCKGFFRRSLAHKDKYVCKPGDKRCGILKSVAIKSCQYCRYQRCVAAGMSKQAIRSGRYTYAMRTRNLQEVRGLDDSELSSVMSTVASPTDTKYQDRPLRTHLSPVSVTSLSPDSGYSEIGTSPPLFLNLDYDMDSNCVLSTSSVDPLPGRAAIESLDDLELEQTITNITDCHRKFSDHLHLLENEEELKAQQERSYELAKLNESIFGDLKGLSRAEYRDFFQVTGIDIDDRHWRAGIFMEYLEGNIVAQVQFAKGIKGFKDILLEDQCKLLKGSYSELTLFDGHGTYNSDLDVKILPGGLSFQPQKVCYLDNGKWMTERTNFAKSLNLMKLNCTETALIKAIILLFTDRLPLDIPADVDNLQLKIVKAFRHYLRKTYPNFKKRFTSIWNTIIQARTISLMQEEVRRNSVIDFPEMKNFPLVYDMHEPYIEPEF